MVRHEYTAAKHAAAFSGTFECRFCGLDAPAVVHARGSGAAKGHGEDSARQAEESAEADANAVASRTLTFYPCPKCGKVDPSSRSYRIQVMIGSLAIGGVVAAVLYFYQRAGARYTLDTSDEQIIALVVGFLVSLAPYFYWSRAWWGVKNRVKVDMSRATITPRDDD